MITPRPVLASIETPWQKSRPDYGWVICHFLSRIAARINVSEAILRSPDELQQLYESARGRAGTLADVIGGQCVSHGFCAAKFACVGCAGKVPEPAKRYQIEKHKQWALQQVDYAVQEGLYPEAERLKYLGSR